MSENAKLTHGPIRGHLVTQTAPMIVGVAAMMSIGLIDAYFIGQLGSAELAAISFIFPITVAVTSLAIGLMVGINSVVARALGEGDSAKATRRANLGLVVSVALGLLVGLLLYALLDPLFALMQAPPDLRGHINKYMGPFALGLPLSTTLMAINGILRAQGEAKRTLVISLVFAGANWVLDPLLITGAFGLKGFGIAGAAYATVIGWSMSAVIGLYLVHRTHLRLDPRVLKDCHIPSVTWEILRVAAPASFSNAINPIGLSVLTALLAGEGTAAIAGFGAAGRVQSFAVVPLLALSGAIGAIVGQNWGAKMPARAREAMLWAGGFSVVYGLVVASILSLFGGWFADFFTDDPAIIGEFTSYLRIAAWGYAGFGLLIVANGALNAVDKASYALAQSFARVFLVMLPVGWVMRPYWGADAIYAAELAANGLGGALAGLVVWRVLRRGSAKIRK